MFYATIKSIVYASTDRVVFKSTFGSDCLTIINNDFVRTYPSNIAVCKVEDVKIYTNRELFEATRNLVIPSDISYSDYPRYAMGAISGRHDLTPEPLVYDYTNAVSRFSSFLGLLVGKNYNSKVVTVAWDSQFDYCVIVIGAKALTGNEYVDLRVVLDSIHSNDGLGYITKCTRAKSVREYAERLGCKAYITRNLKSGADLEDVIVDVSLDGFWGNTPLLALDSHVNASLGTHLERRYITTEDGMYCLFYTAFPMYEGTIDKATVALADGDTEGVVKLLKDQVVLGPWIGQCDALDCSAILKDVL